MAHLQQILNGHASYCRYLCSPISSRFINTISFITFLLTDITINNQLRMNKKVLN